MAQLRSVSIQQTVQIGGIGRTLSGAPAGINIQLGNMTNTSTQPSAFYRDPLGNTGPVSAGGNIQSDKLRTRTLAFLTGTGALSSPTLQTLLSQAQQQGYFSLWNRAQSTGALTISTGSANTSNPNPPTNTGTNPVVPVSYPNGGTNPYIPVSYPNGGTNPYYPASGGNPNFYTVPASGGNPNFYTVPASGGNPNFYTVPASGGNPNFSYVGPSPSYCNPGYSNYSGSCNNCQYNCVLCCGNFNPYYPGYNQNSGTNPYYPASYPNGGTNPYYPATYPNGGTNPYYPTTYPNGGTNPSYPASGGNPNFYTVPASGGNPNFFTVPQSGGNPNFAPSPANVAANIHGPASPLVYSQGYILSQQSSAQQITVVTAGLTPAQGANTAGSIRAIQQAGPIGSMVVQQGTLQYT